MNKKIILIGASGHGKVIFDIVRAQGDTVIGFLDDREVGSCCGVPILGTIDAAKRYPEAEFIISIGSNIVRRKIAERLSVRWATAIHPSAVVSPSATIGLGTVIMANAVVQAEAVVGMHCILNTACIVEHENKIGNYVHLSPCAALGGNVTVGIESHIGIGACVRNNVKICDGCTIGAGAVVVKNLETSGTYVGVPVRRTK